MQKLILPLIILMALTLTLTACSSEKTITRLTNTDSFDEYPSWSPDGTKIAFASRIDGNFEIYVLDY
jgi:Tol biopolymer transport system component